jgi:NEDD8-activating enzyme E1
MISQALSKTATTVTTLSSSVGHSASGDAIGFMKTARILVIGAGGLGCEILKNLALSGFSDIHVIDMDTIDLTNLNRQFLFRQKDIGRPKAQVAAEFISRKYPEVKITPYVGKIQDYPPSFYASFFMVIAGLDNIQARRWINSVVHDLVEYHSNSDGLREPDPSTIRFLLDGGTEGLKGQARVIIPTITSCFECTLDTFPPQTNFPLCTIAETPRLPEHCIEYALLIEWPSVFPSRNPNFDNPEDTQWLFTHAKSRADNFNISGVTYQLTLGVVKRIIPAVASTNAIIAGILVVEAIKIATYCAPVLESWLMYMGQSGLYTSTYAPEKIDSCLVCGGLIVKTINVDDVMTLSDILDYMVEHFGLTSPSVTTPETVVFMQKPAALRAMHEHKLGQTFKDLLMNGEIKGDLWTVTDPVMVNKLNVQLQMKNISK